MKKFFIILVISLAFPFLCLLPLSFAQPPKGVILISLDTLRADHLGTYGYSCDTSPFIDAFARDNIVFENAVVQSPWTLPSHMSIMTSLYPSFHGVVKEDRSLADEHTTLAELMREGGYRTAAFTDGWLLKPRYGFGRGFDTYKSKRIGIEKIIPQVKQWLENNRDNKFFLFIHCYDIHSPYNPSPPYNSVCHDFVYTGSLNPSHKKMLLAAKGELSVSNEDLRHIVALYDGGIRYTDEKIGGLLSYLQDKGLFEESLIIITSDHGEEFFEHGSFMHRQLYFRPNLHVPLIMHVPAFSKGTMRIEELVQSIDLLPTILEICELSPHDGAQGRSLLPLIEQEANYIKKFWSKILSLAGIDSSISFAEHSQYNNVSVINDSYQLIYNLEKDAAQLFNLSVDPLAKNNIVDKHGAVSDELLGKFKNVFNEENSYGTKVVALDDSTREKLRAIGYLDTPEQPADDENIADIDRDGVLDDVDNCFWSVNPQQKDMDRDGVGDICDNCKRIPNPKQADDDEDLMGDVCDKCTDTDWDGFGTPGFFNTCAEDNCPFIFNPLQKDEDGYGIGDLCEESMGHQNNDNTIDARDTYPEG